MTKSAIIIALLVAACSRQSPEQAWNEKPEWCKQVLSTTGPADLSTPPNTQATTPREQRYRTGLTEPSKEFISKNCGQYPWKQRQT